MTKRKISRSQRRLTPEEKSRLRCLRAEVEAEKDDIVRRGREVFKEHERSLSEALGTLRRARESLGLSLQEVAQRMGTDRGNVHRLENTPGNPTVGTLARYADAMGKRIVITVTDAPT